MPEIPLPPVQATDVNVHDLKYYLNANDESNFLKCMEVVQNDVVKNQLEDLIEMAVQRNFKDAVYGLLGRAEGVVGNLERAANIAIERGLPDILDRSFVTRDLFLALLLQGSRYKLWSFGSGLEWQLRGPWKTNTCYNTINYLVC